MTRKFVGCVLNPKTRRPCPVYVHDGDDVRVWSPTLSKEGDGYFSSENDDDKYKKAEGTGYPRVHTPRGVYSKGEGYGTVLYTGLCLGAKLEDEGLLALATTTRGAGVCSNNERSASASAWWNAAVSQFDLAFREETEEEEEEDIDSYQMSRRRHRGVYDAAEEALENEDGYSTSINDIVVDGTRMISASSIADVYPYDNERGCLGAAVMVPFWMVLPVSPYDDHPWERNRTSLDIEEGPSLFVEVFGSMNFTKTDKQLLAFLRAVAVETGDRALFDDTLLASVLGGTIADAQRAAEGADGRYAELRPNPSTRRKATDAVLQTTVRKERVVLQRQAEWIKGLGLAKLSRFTM